MSGKWNGSRHNANRAGSGWEEQAAATRILERDGYRCYYRGPDCEGTALLVDHVIPSSVTGPAGDHASPGVVEFVTSAGNFLRPTHLSGSE